MAALNTTGLNEAFDLLTHPCRRYVLYHLKQESGVTDVDCLATAVTEWDGDHARTGRSPGGVATALRHVHLPKLADAGIITFGVTMDVVELEQTDGLDRFLSDTAHIDGYAQTAADD